jgi:hypothetical protein
MMWQSRPSDGVLLARLLPGIPDLDPLKPPQQPPNVLGQFLMRDVVRDPSQRLADAIQEDDIGPLRIHGLELMSFDVAQHAGRCGTGERRSPDDRRRA